MLCRAEKWGRRASGGRPWSLGRGTGLSATGRAVSCFALVYQLLSTLDEAGVQTGRGKKNASDLRCGQNAAPTRVALWGLLRFSAAGTAGHRESIRSASALPASGTVAAGDLAL